MTSAEPPDILTSPDNTGPVWTGTDDPAATPAPNEASSPPITRTPFQNSSTRALAEAMTLTNDPISVQRRWGRIDAINGDDTVNVLLSGEVIEGIAYDSQYAPTVDEIVRLDIVGPDMVVVGPIAPSPRAFRRPVGDIEMSLVVKPDTLPLQGQVVSRTTYANLWAWVQANNLVAAGLFTNGNGSTTFGLPNFSGRVPVGAGTLGADTYTVGGAGGSATTTLTTNQMPAHNHSVAVEAHAAHTHTVTATGGAHSHDFTTSTSGDHAHNFTSGASGDHAHNFTTGESGLHAHNFTTGGGGGHAHFTAMKFMSGQVPHAHAGAFGTFAEGTDIGSAGADIGTNIAGDHVHNGTTVQAASHLHNGTTVTVGSHVHNGTTATTGGHSHSGTTAGSGTLSVSGTTASGGPTTHTVTQNTVGGTTAVDIRQPFVGIQYLIWV